MSTGSPLRSAITSTTRRIGVLSTYPPKLCGLATFAVALEGELRRVGHRVDMVRITDGNEPPTIGRDVVAELVNGDPSSIRSAASVLSRSDVAIIQHEYGIYGGADGDEIIDLLHAVDVPTIVIFHTVPLRPTSHQRSLLTEIAQLADSVVVMSDTARRRLTESYAVDPSDVIVIPHGAALPAKLPDQSATLGRTRPQLLTWGLIGPGKGIEHVINALALLGDLRPRPRYTVAGVTHPKVFAQHGDQYRHSLIQRAWAAGVAGSVTFDDTYRNVSELTRYIASSTAVVLPYDSREQVTSGVLVDAIAAGRPVIATSFPHAVELLGTGAGLVVPHGDSVALAEAIRLVLSDDETYSTMAAEARRVAQSLSWPTVARQYVGLAERLVVNDRVAI